MGDPQEGREIIWASWHVAEDGRVEIVATHETDAGYTRRELTYASLDEAAETLGPGFRDVVTRSMEAGARSGRWRP